jgi:predicted lactoylglutathione lyase
MEQRLNMLMLPVDDLDTVRAFYARLGWKPWGMESPLSTGFLASGTVIVFLDRAYLQKESGLQAPSGTASAVMVLNVAERDEVDRICERVIDAGAKVTSPARPRDGGLYSFYFLDPVGAAWEVVWNPHMPMTASGVLTLPQ